MTRGDLNAKLSQLFNQLYVAPQSTGNRLAQHAGLWRQLNFNQTPMTRWLSLLPLQSRQHEETAREEVVPDIA